MKLFYVKASIFTSSYRCGLVRQRLIRFVKQNPPLAIVVSGLEDEHLIAYHQFIKQFKANDIQFISDCGHHQVKEIPLYLHKQYLQAGDLSVVPIEGTIAIIRKKNQCSMNYMLFDIFADESFADYHGELDDQLIEELRNLLKSQIKKPDHDLN